MRCIRCHRQLTRDPVDGMGPVCAKRAKRAKPQQAIERDLFGYDVAGAASQATERVSVLVKSLAIEAHIAVRREFAAARRRLGVWHG